MNIVKAINLSVLIEKIFGIMSISTQLLIIRI